MRKVVVHAVLLVEVVDDRSVFTSEWLEAFFAARVGQATGIEDKAAAIAGLIDGQSAMEGEAGDADRELVGFLRDVLQFL